MAERLFALSFCFFSSDPTFRTHPFGMRTVRVEYGCYQAMHPCGMQNKHFGNDISTETGVEAKQTFSNDIFSKTGIQFSDIFALDEADFSLFPLYKPPKSTNKRTFGLLAHRLLYNKSERKPNHDHQYQHNEHSRRHRPGCPRRAGRQGL